jgi:NAD(P)-dependent dehydrogenase (short-subunit alcohol dehydrogenase family)
VTAVLVTGAAGHIGHAIAAELAAAGTPLILADHPSQAEALEEAASRLASDVRMVDSR